MKRRFIEEFFFFYWRNTMMQSHVSQPSGISFGLNNQLQFQSQQPPPPPPPLPPPQQTLHQLRQIPQQAQQPSHLRHSNGSSNVIGAWPNNCKQAPALSNSSSLFNFPTKQMFDTSSGHNPVRMGHPLYLKRVGVYCLFWENKRILKFHFKTVYRENFSGSGKRKTLFVSN